MPGMDGFETTARIKQIAPDLPVLMLSSDARPGDILRRRAAGVSGHAVKPVSRTELRRLICNAIHPTGKPEITPTGSAHARKIEQVGPIRILVAEDSPDNSLLIEVYLNESGHQVTFVEDGEAAVDRFTTSEYDLILMDVHMPLI